MKLIFLGAASGLVRDTDNFQSNMLLVTDAGKKLLIDCGTDIRFSLKKVKYKAEDIDAVFISHLHADHAGGLEWLALQRKFICQNNLPELIIHENLVHPLWDNCLSGGLKTLKEKEASLNDYFIVTEVKDAQVYEWEGLKIDLIQTVHIYSNEELKPTYGLTIEYQGKKYFISADAQFTPDIWDGYFRESTLIFHDCETLESPSGVHAHFNELKTLPPAIKAKTWLYHYNDGELPDAKAEGFLGFIHCGQIIKL